MAVTMVRDEMDVLPYTIGHLMSQGLDQIVVADNRSVDGTREWLDDWASTFPHLAVVEDDPEVAYLQSSKMTGLAARHAEPGDWVVPFDADEVWHAIDAARLGDALRWASDFDICAATPFVHVPTDLDLWTDPDPLTRIRCRMFESEPHPKVAFRWAPDARIDMGNHGVTGAGFNLDRRTIGVRHFQYRSLEQLRRKVTNGVEAYSATSFGATVGTHWRELASLDDASLAEWWDRYTHQGGLVLDPAPVGRGSERRRSGERSE